jgi:hypothetical protein
MYLHRRGTRQHVTLGELRGERRNLESDEAKEGEESDRGEILTIGRFRNQLSKEYEREQFRSRVLYRFEQVGISLTDEMLARIMANHDSFCGDVESARLWFEARRPVDAKTSAAAAPEASNLVSIRPSAFVHDEPDSSFTIDARSTAVVPSGQEQQEEDVKLVLEAIQRMQREQDQKLTAIHEDVKLALQLIEQSESLPDGLRRSLRKWVQ